LFMPMDQVLRTARLRLAALAFSDRFDMTCNSQHCLNRGQRAVQAAANGWHMLQLQQPMTSDAHS
jgi:hypothetical protein